MSVKHKWHKEIKAWADGAEIEGTHGLFDWYLIDYPNWHGDNVQFRIKPQPKEQPYWLCCGCTDPRHNKECLEAEMGHPERCRYGTASENSNSQPKEPQYLYAYSIDGEITFLKMKPGALIKCKSPTSCFYIGKIKLEVDYD